MGKKASQQARISAIALLTAGILTGIVALLAQTTSFTTAKTILVILSLVYLLGSVFYFVRSRAARKSEQNQNLPTICKEQRKGLISYD